MFVVRLGICNRKHRDPPNTASQGHVFTDSNRTQNETATRRSEASDIPPLVFERAQIELGNLKGSFSLNSPWKIPRWNLCELLRSFS